MTTPDLTDKAARERLLEICEKATPGPWWNDGLLFLGNGSEIWGQGSPAIAVSLVGAEGEAYSTGQAEADQEHIAAWNPEAAKAALDMIGELLKENARLRANRNAPRGYDPFPGSGD